MTDRGGNTLSAREVESNNTTVAEWELNLALALLAGNLSGNGAIDLVGEPILAGNALELKDGLHIVIEIFS